MAVNAFQLLLKGCTIEAVSILRGRVLKFQLLLKGCTIEAYSFDDGDSDIGFVSVVERMYD